MGYMKRLYKPKKLRNKKFNILSHLFPVIILSRYSQEKL